MKNILKFLFAFLSFVLIFSSCNKYELGPGLTILTKKQRITGKWEKQLTYSGNGFEVKNEGIREMEIFKDGLITYTVDTTRFTGNWEFIKDKESISITNDYFKPSSYKMFRIIKLKNKEILLEDEFGVDHRFKKK
jgi:hypothetical protein